MPPTNDSQSEHQTPRYIFRVLIKAGILFFLVNIFFVVSNPLPALGSLSFYNILFPGRLRLPYGDNPSLAYNLTLSNLAAMFASHEISSGPKPPNEYRVLMIGDSATWGYLQSPEEAVAAQLNQMGLTLPDGRLVKVYNLGYPAMSLMKDLLILSQAVAYDPDLIIWPFTLESFPYDKQLYSPVIQDNQELVAALIRDHRLSLDPLDPAFDKKGWFDRTVIGRRRDLADLIRLQIYGVLWAATGIDQELPQDYPAVSQDLSADTDFHNLSPPHLTETDLAMEIIQAGMDIAGDIPVLLVNEPIYIARGENSDVRYNFYYPQWAYDDFRLIMSEAALQNDWLYQDVWDLIPPSEFTNTAVHLSPAGAKMFAEDLATSIIQVADQAK